MRNIFRLAAAGVLLAGASHTGAQEINCDQKFMNDSENAICGSPDLMRLDLEMGQAFRRAEPHMPRAKSQHRVFRRALRSCKGDVECLTESYESRNEELRTFINTLPQATEEEADALGQAYDREAEIREAYVAQLTERLQREAEEAAEAEKLRFAEAQAREEAAALEAQRVQEDQARMAAAREAAVASQVPVSRGKQDKDFGVGFIAVVLFVVVAMIMGAWEWLKSAVDRCPRCTKWFAGEIVDQDREAYTDYETVNRVETRRNAKYENTGTRHYKEQVSVRVVKTRSLMKCRNCKHEWVSTSTSRNS